jgi:hypothetical protein
MQPSPTIYAYIDAYP